MGLTTQPDTPSLGLSKLPFPGSRAWATDKLWSPEAAAACTLRSELWPGFSLVLEWLSPQAGTKPVQPPRHPAAICSSHFSTTQSRRLPQACRQQIRSCRGWCGLGVGGVLGCGWLSFPLFLLSAVPSYLSAHSGPQASWGCHAQGRWVG